MKRIRTYKTLGLLIATLVAPSGAVVGQTHLERELRAAVASVPHPQTQVGACVVDLASGRTVFAHNADVSMTPASTMKLFTMAAACDVLGVEFAFRTVFATDGTNLYMIGDGDPGLGDPRLAKARGEPIDGVFARWAEALADRGVTTVPGDLIVDASVLDDEFFHPAWEPSDLGKWYAAPVAGLNFNDNCIDITLTPTAGPNAPVAVSFVPQNSLVRIVNECRTGKKGKPILRHAYDSFEYRVSGQCSKRWPFGPVSFPDPVLLAADSFRTVLTGRGISIAGSIRKRRVRRPDGTVPPELQEIAVETTPLVDVLVRIGKNSQNLFAECVMKRLGRAWAVRDGSADQAGSWAMGRRAIRATVDRAGLDATGLTVSDGSGLSRENACTPRQLVELLAWVHAQPFGDVFRDSLSVAGVDGSLRKRLKDAPGRVIGKTGTMRGVTSLAGYVMDAEGSRYAFAVLFNGYPGPSKPYRAIQDRIGRILATPAASRKSNGTRGAGPNSFGRGDRR